MSESDIDRALAEGFRGSSPPSVLRAIERLTGEMPRILLRDGDSHSGASPMIDASSSEKRSIPQGRGSYQILGEIARGGMGVVMKGHDTDLGRDVAMKVLHKDLAKRPEVLQRFVEEAQIGGQLQHPGIVPVYELGLMADERPYFTMRLVKGRTLAARLAERKSPAIDRRSLLDVFESVCQTIAYAHSRGVIHRDLKPANVMVGAFGEVQVVDWGLAKVLRQGGTADEKRAKQTNISIIETVRSEPGSHGSHSLVGSVMGTPAYMSPEQARGEVDKLDERSDVFSLGAILCEILTGAPPYLGENDKTLVEAANARLDDATKRLEGCEADTELVALCRECLAPAPSARPRSAEVLAQRIHGYSISVEERARQAQVDAAGARVKAQEERHARKLTVGLAASIFVTILIAGGGWAWTSSERSRRERDTETQVGVALNEATLKRGESQWAEALAAVERAKGLADSGAASDGLRARVSRDLASIESEANAARSRDDLLRDNSALLAELADVRQPEGDKTYPTDWAKLDAEHRAIFAHHGLDADSKTEIETAGSWSARGIAVDLGAALDEWAAVRSGAGDTSGAASLSSLARRIDGDPTRDKLRDALGASDIATLKAFAANEDLEQLPATTLHLLGKALSKSAAVDEAISVFRRAQRVHPGDFMLTMSLARRLLHASPPMAREAARYYTAARALRPASTEAIHELAKTLEESLNDSARAAELFRAAVALHPDDAHLRAHLATSLGGLGDHDAAIATAREAVALAPNDAFARFGLGNRLDDKGDYEGAIVVFRQAIDLDPEDAAKWNNLGHALQAQLDFDGALAAFRRAVELDPRYVGAQDNIGYVLQRMGDLDGAIEAHHKAIQIDPKFAGAYGNLGRALSKKGNVDEAIECHRKTIELDPTLGIAHLNLGIDLEKKGEVVAAIASYRKAVELGPPSANTQFRLGLALAGKGDVDGAIASYRLAVGLDGHDAAALLNLGSLLNDIKGDHEGAIEAFRKASELDPKSCTAQCNLGIALRAAGDLEGAVTAERNAIALDPKYATAYQTLGSLLDDQGDRVGALKAWHKAIDLAPNNAATSNEVAWHLATCPDLTRRDGPEAVLLALHSVELVPDPGNLNTLGAAQCCAGEWRKAIEALDRSVQLNRPTDESAQHVDADNHCFLAIAHAHMGEVDKAREALALAESWHAAHPGHANAAETGRFLDEARAAIEASPPR